MSGTITYKVGDLIESDEYVIAHGCNMHGVMGAGIAKQVREKFYDVFCAYKHACDVGNFPLGTAQAVYSSPAGYAGRWTYNLATQRAPGPDATTWGIFLAFSNMGEDMIGRNFYEVAIPRIGAGIGGLNWDDDVVPAIQDAQDRCSRTFNVIVYDLPTGGPKT